MNGSMGIIRYLILGTKGVDVDGLRERYGSPPRGLSHYPTENIHLRDEGDSEAPIILLHGHGDLHTWNQLVKYLVEDYRVIRFDVGMV